MTVKPQSYFMYDMNDINTTNTASYAAIKGHVTQQRSACIPLNSEIAYKV